MPPTITPITLTHTVTGHKNDAAPSPSPSPSSSAPISQISLPMPHPLRPYGIIAQSNSSGNSRSFAYIDVSSDSSRPHFQQNSLHSRNTAVDSYFYPSSPRFSPTTRSRSLFIATSSTLVPRGNRSQSRRT